MARILNSQGFRVAGSIEMIAAGREGTLEISVADPEVLIPTDVSDNLPDPFCCGAILYGTAGADRVLVHFPTDARYPDAAKAGLRILDRITREMFADPAEQSVFSLTVTGDWHRLRLAGSKTLLFSVHDVEMERRRAGTKAPGFGLPGNATISSPATAIQE